MPDIPLRPLAGADDLASFVDFSLPFLDEDEEDEVEVIDWAISIPHQVSWGDGQTPCSFAQLLLGPATDYHQFQDTVEKQTDPLKRTTWCSTAG